MQRAEARRPDAESQRAEMKTCHFMHFLLNLPKVNLLSSEADGVTLSAGLDLRAIGRAGATTTR
jgi:hypothetical protein